MGQSSSVESIPGGAPEVLTGNGNDVKPNKDTTYHFILKSQLQKTYDHMGQYLIAKGFFDVELSEESQDAEATLSFGPSEEIMQADFQAIDSLLDEIAKAMWHTVIGAFFGTIILTPISAAIWFLTPLHKHDNDEEIIWLLLAGIVWLLPGALFSRGLATLGDFFWMWRCRYMASKLKEKFRDGVLQPEDRKKLKAKSWDLVAIHVGVRHKNMDPVTPAGEVSIV